MKRSTFSVFLVLAFAAALFALEVKGQNVAALAQETPAQKSGAVKTGYSPEKTPTKAIQELDAMLDDFHIGKLTAQQEEENRQLKKKIIHGTFDIHELSKLSLARHWNEISPEEQEHFVKLLTDLLEEKALFSKEQLAAKSKTAKKYHVIYKGHKFSDAKKERSFVSTKVIVPAENIDITLNYKMKRQDGEWKIFDVIVDNASLVDNYRYQFDSIIKKNGYSDLVRRMANKLDEIKAKRQEKNSNEG
jgi:phospholipid transport system substrate-binding protein